MSGYCVLTLSKFDDHLDRLLDSFSKMQPNLSLSDIYVVDDGLSTTIKEKWKVHYVEGRKPFSFASNFNIGIKAIPQDKDVFLIGDDVLLGTLDGIEILAKDVYGIENIAMASPVIIGGVKNPYQRAGFLNRLALREELVNLPGYIRTLIFVAVYLKREFIEKAGAIPEELTGYGYEDDYYSKRMLDLRYEWVIDPNVLVIHGWGEHTSATSYHRSGLDPKALMQQNREIYEKLIGEDPENPSVID